jgi:uncharacterized phage infection (PIP) family protein YhgE
MFKTIKNLKKINAIIELIDDHKALIQRAFNVIEGIKDRLNVAVNNLRTLKEELDTIKGKLNN